MSCPNKQPERHGEYYHPDGTLHLLVDDVLFRVHAYFFERDSEKFRKILGSPVAPNQARIGSSDSKPYPIKNSSPSEFGKFLWVIYNTTYSDYTKANTSDWTSILKIACEYDFVEMQHCAIRGLELCELTTVERIHIYELYKADHKYLVPLYIEMVKREDAPTNGEVKCLGSETALLIFRLREYLRSRPSVGGKSPLPAGVDDEDALDAVCIFLHLDRSRLQIPGARTLHRLSRARRRVPTPRRQSPDRETLEEWRHARDFGQFIEELSVAPATQKDDVVEGQIQTIPGQFEIRKKDAVNNDSVDHEHLQLVLYREKNTSVGSLEKGDVENISLVLNSGRSALLVCALSWTFISFWALNNIPRVLLL